MKKHKVLILTPGYPDKTHPIAGIFVQEYAKATSVYNDVLVFYAIANSSQKQLYRMHYSTEGDIKIIKVTYRPFFSNTNFFIPRIFRMLAPLLYFPQIIKCFGRPDIINAHIYSAAVPAVILRIILNIPVAVTEHFSWIARHKMTWERILGAKFVFNRCDIVLPVSRNLQKHIISYRVKNRFEVVFNTVNTEIFYPAKQKMPREKIKKMLIVASFVLVKGIEYLLEAIGKLRTERSDFTLDIIGDGPLRKKYGLMIGKLNLKEHVHFRGILPKKDIAEIIRKADFFVLPSIWENMPCVLTEAIASGLPVVATSVGGVPEIIDKDIGILVPPKDVDALKESIDYMLDNFEHYNSQRLFNYARDKFSYESIGRQLTKIYDRVIATYEKKMLRKYVLYKLNKFIYAKLLLRIIRVLKHLNFVRRMA